MAYQALITKIKNVHKDPNSDRLYLGECFNEGVIIGPDYEEDDLVLYLPSDGKIERWFGDTFKLFRKNEDGTLQGGYIDSNGHIKAIKLRGNQSSGVVIKVETIEQIFGEQGWKDGDKVDKINNRQFCKKYIPHMQKGTYSGLKGTSYKGKKVDEIVYPEFEMHKETAQLAYNLDAFKPGDIINLSLKMHGTSSRHMKTYCEVPRGFFRKLFHMKPKIKNVYVCGSRKCVITEDSKGYYENCEFRLKHHKALEPFIEDGVECFGEIVGYYGPNETDTIMPIGDNTKLNDKAFIKEFGESSIFNYGCKPGESKLYIYRITSNNGEREWTPNEICEWCDKNGLLHVPYIETFEFTTVKDLQERVNNYLKDLHDPIGLTHIKEGVVVRIVNRRTFTAYKAKTWEFKVIEGIIKDTNSEPDIEEAQEEI